MKIRHDWVNSYQHKIPPPNIEQIYEFSFPLPMVRGLQRIQLSHLPRGVKRWRVVHFQSNKILCDWLPSWCLDIRVIFELLPGVNNVLCFSFQYTEPQDGDEIVEILTSLINEGDIFA